MLLSYKSRSREAIKAPPTIASYHSKRMKKTSLSIVQKGYRFDFWFHAEFHSNGELFHGMWGRWNFSGHKSPEHKLSLEKGQLYAHGIWGAKIDGQTERPTCRYWVFLCGRVLCPVLPWALSSKIIMHSADQWSGKSFNRVRVHICSPE